MPQPSSVEPVLQTQGVSVVVAMVCALASVHFRDERRRAQNYAHSNAEHYGGRDIPDVVCCSCPGFADQIVRSVQRSFIWIRKNYLESRGGDCMPTLQPSHVLIT